MLAFLSSKTVQMTYSSCDLMKIAIEEHLKCSEYPRVGSVISKNGNVLSTGHRGETANGTQNE